jgi:2-hydroxy-6-oxonona-2,4-dienedioate hydrolase
LSNLADATRLKCHVEGRGPALVLLHGGMGSWTHWIRNIPVLRERFTVHAFDLPGCGDSLSVPDDIDPQTYIGFVCDAVREVAGPGRVRLAGFSFGGVLAAMVAARMPGKIERLALLAPGGFGRASGRALDLRKMPEMPASEAECREVLRHNLMVLMLAKPETADDATIDIQRDNVTRTRYDSRRFSLDAYTVDALPQITAPALVIYGERDNLAWPSIGARIDPCRSLKPDMRIEVIPEVGHWVQYEAAAEVNRLLIEFFS